MLIIRVPYFRKLPFLISLCECFPYALVTYKCKGLYENIVIQGAFSAWDLHAVLPSDVVRFVGMCVEGSDDIFDGWSFCEETRRFL